MNKNTTSGLKKLILKKHNDFLINKQPYSDGERSLENGMTKEKWTHELS